MIVKAIHNMCGQRSEEREFDNPTLAIKTGYKFGNLLKILERESGKEEDTSNLQELDHFKKVHEAYWLVIVSHHA